MDLVGDFFSVLFGSGREVFGLGRRRMVIGLSG